MFQQFFLALREARVPVTLTEYLTLLEAVAEGAAGFSAEQFYYLLRACLVKDERHIDKFDRVFAQSFHGIAGEDMTLPDFEATIPRDWLETLAERLLSPEEKEKIQALGGFEALIETLLQRIREQQEAHHGGNKWIGTAGTSPFGAMGYHPEGVRIGQPASRHRKAVKVWDRREFRISTTASNSTPVASKWRCAGSGVSPARERPANSTSAAPSKPLRPREDCLTSSWCPSGTMR